MQVSPTGAGRGPLPPSLVDLHLDALHRMGAVVAAISDADLENPTPCGEWNVGEVVEHIIGLNFGFAEVLTVGTAREDAFESRSAPLWRDSVAAVEAALAARDDGPEQFTVVPVSADLRFPRRDVVSIHLLDVAVHTWDVSAGLGVRFEPPAETVEAIADMAAMIAAAPLPSTREQFAPPFASPEVEPGWHQVLRLLGRDPDWTPLVAHRDAL